MGSTPRTDAVYDVELLNRGIKENGRSWGWGTVSDFRELAKTLELELSAAIVNEAIAENKAHILGKELKQANNRIKRLENRIETLKDCGDSLFNSLTRDEAMKRWKRAKEAKL